MEKAYAQAISEQHNDHDSDMQHFNVIQTENVRTAEQGPSNKGLVDQVASLGNSQDSNSKQSAERSLLSQALLKAETAVSLDNSLEEGATKYTSKLKVPSFGAPSTASDTSPIELMRPRTRNRPRNALVDYDSEEDGDEKEWIDK